MITTFKLKTQRTKGIEVSSPTAQASEIATLIGATSFAVNVSEASATFVFGEPSAQLTVKVGQVISVTNGSIAVNESAEFYDMFEPDN